ncbi:CBS/transporter associated domain protein [Yersinia ruckeri ATCC 29473]|nr:CBS/transporter associated domain protein [Yersinia ruckeri ATCC 29473]
MFPSSARSLSLILREAASEISDKEKKALTAIRKRISKILFNIIYPCRTDDSVGDRKEGSYI